MTDRKFLERMHGPWTAVPRQPHSSSSAQKIISRGGAGSRYAEVMGNEGRWIGIIAEGTAAAPEALEMLDQIRREYGVTGRLSGETIVQLDNLLRRFDRHIAQMDQYVR